MHKLFWKELRERRETCLPNMPDYIKATDEINYRLKRLGLIIAALAVVVTAVYLFI